MEITSVHRTVPAASSAADATPAETAAESRQLIQAIKAVNGTELLGQDYELQYQKEAKKQQLIVRLLNRRTDELVAVVPVEYVLRLAEQFSRE